MWASEGKADPFDSSDCSYPNIFFSFQHCEVVCRTMHCAADFIASFRLLLPIYLIAFAVL